MKSRQARERHAAILRLRAAELRQAARPWDVVYWLLNKNAITRLVEESERAARALEGAAVALTKLADHVDDAERYTNELAAAAELVTTHAAKSGQTEEE